MENAQGFNPGVAAIVAKNVYIDDAQPSFSDECCALCYMLWLAFWCWQWFM